MYLNLIGSWRSSGCSVLRLEIVFLECLLDTTMGVFHGYQIALELSSFVPLKKKQELRKLITSNDGVVSFIVTKKVNDSDYFLTRLSSISWLCLAPHSGADCHAACTVSFLSFLCLFASGRRSWSGFCQVTSTSEEFLEQVLYKSSLTIWHILLVYLCVI